MLREKEIKYEWQKQPGKHTLDSAYCGTRRIIYGTGENRTVPTEQ